MAKKPSAGVAKAILASSPKTSEDRLDKIRAKAKEARSLELEIAELVAKTNEKSEKLRTLYQSTLPTMMSEYNVPSITIGAEGNFPALTFEKHTYYSANIAAGWEAERKQKGFDTLKKYKADDLIKTEVSAKLPKGSLAVAKKAMAALKKLGIKNADLKQSVHPQTLTAWLRSRYDDKDTALPVVDLEAIGASIGEIVRVKDQKKD